MLRRQIILNASQRTFVASTFAGIERSLSTAAEHLEVRDESLLFPPCEGQATPVESAVVREGLERLRKRMRDILNACDITPAADETGCLHALHVALEFAHVSLEEAEPQRLTAFGEISSEQGASLHAAVAELHTILEAIGVASGKPNPEVSP